MPYLDPIKGAHVSEPGLVVVAAALAFQQLLADRWATATAEHTTRASLASGCAATWICARNSVP
ncbi:DUF6207 family protein [Streptomyces flaveus]